jgi:hypothetical protein
MDARGDDERATTIGPHSHGDGQYDIRVAGHLSTHWADRFDGMELRAEPDGTTVIHGPVIDQAALHGILQQVRDLGLELLSVVRTTAS